MLVDTYAHPDIERQFLAWVKEEKVRKEPSVVIA